MFQSPKLSVFHMGLYSLNGPTSYRIVKSRSREIHVYTFPIGLKFDRHLVSSAAEMPVKFQRVAMIVSHNLAASTLHEILR